MSVDMLSLRTIQKETNSKLCDLLFIMLYYFAMPCLCCLYIYIYIYIYIYYSIIYNLIRRNVEEEKNTEKGKIRRQYLTVQLLDLMVCLGTFVVRACDLNTVIFYFTRPSYSLTRHCIIIYMISILKKNL